IANTTVSGGAGGTTTAPLGNGGNGGEARGGGIEAEGNVTDALHTLNVTIAYNFVAGGREGDGGAGGQTGTPGQGFGGGIDGLVNPTLTNTIVSNDTADIGPDLSGAFLLLHSLI